MKLYVKVMRMEAVLPEINVGLGKNIGRNIGGGKKVVRVGVSLGAVELDFWMNRLRWGCGNSAVTTEPDKNKYYIPYSTEDEALEEK
jgi:hypothetical protein